MLTVADAHQLMMAHASPLPAERTPLLQALGRVLASPVLAPGGAKLVGAGELVTPARVGLVAGLGRSHVTVHAPCRVAVVTLGDGFAEPGATPAADERYDANSYAVAAMVAEAGGVPVRLAMSAEPKALARSLRQALGFDMAILASGPDGPWLAAAGELGQVFMREVAQRPAMPLSFAMALGKPLIGMPGSPAAALVAFECYVRPLLRRMMGHRSQERPKVVAVMREAYAQPPGRQGFVHAHIERVNDGYEARLAAEDANALVVVPAGSTGFVTGDTREVILLEPPEVCGMACLPIGGAALTASKATLL